MKLFPKLTLALLSLILFQACKDQEKKPDTTQEEVTTEDAVNPVQNTGTTSFEKTLNLQGITFSVKTQGEGSIRQLIVQPEGLKGGNDPYELEIDGAVANAEIEDMNSDGYPELLIYTVSAGSGSYGNVIALSVLGGNSMVPVTFPDISASSEASQGYMGHDEFAVIETTLSRRFPIYKEGDPNSNPTGGTRQINYQMEAGENSPVFRIKSISDN